MPKLNVKKAVKNNPIYAQITTPPWKDRFYQTAAELGYAGLIPAAATFAEGVYSWQKSQPGVTADGMLGPKSWKKLEPFTRYPAGVHSPLPAWLTGIPSTPSGPSGPTEPVPHEYNTPGLLPRYTQETPNGCWGAAVANIYDWKKAKPRRTVTEVLNEIGFRWALTYNAGAYLSGPNFKKLANAAGLRPHRYGDFDHQKYWISTIKSRGKLLMLQEAYGEWTHWIVITGYEITEDGQFRATYFDPDPAEGKRKLWTESAEALYDKLRKALTQGAKVWSY